jgi:hypothetical protein
VGGITIAWLAGEGIIIARMVAKEHRPPSPGALLGSSLFFAGCALLAEYPPARPAATLLAFGVVLAAWLKAPYITPAAAKANPATSKTTVITGL